MMLGVSRVEAFEEEARGRRLHLVSWNVAGWRTTLKEMARTLGPPPVAAEAKKSGSQEESVGRLQGTFRRWLSLLECDVVCLQEVKVRSGDVRDSARALCARLDDGSFESFWASNDGVGGQRRGLNGVATFARAGSVVRAEKAPLGRADLDGEGRCLLTEHAEGFSVFNVYAPNASGGRRLGYKLRWSAALRSAMRRERERCPGGWPVILAGDLNEAPRPEVDRHWTLRSVSPSEDLLPGWATILRCLRGRTVLRTKTKNPRTGETFDKFRCVVAHPATAAPVQIGSHATSRDEAYYAFEVDGLFLDLDDTAAAFQVGSVADYYSSSAAPEATTNDRDDRTRPKNARRLLQIASPNSLNIKDFADVADKLLDVKFAEAELRRILEDGDGRRLPNLRNDEKARTAAADSPAGGNSGGGGRSDDDHDDDDAARSRPRHEATPLDLLKVEDGMIDSFAELHPRARERFTCWDQYRNGRAQNVGSRIDAVFVDAAFFRAADAVAGRLDAHPSQDPDAPQAARHAATLGGRFKAAPFEGGGLPDPKPDDCLHHCRVPPHTGIVYTPPSWSDHVAVSLLLQQLPPKPPSAHQSQPTTTKRNTSCTTCQPHAQLRAITAFLKPRSAAADEPSAKRPKPAAAPAPRKHQPLGIRRYFAPPPTQGPTTKTTTTTNQKNSSKEPPPASQATMPLRPNK